MVYISYWHDANKLDTRFGHPSIYREALMEQFPDIPIQEFKGKNRDIPTGNTRETREEEKVREDNTSEESRREGKPEMSAEQMVKAEKQRLTSLLFSCNVKKEMIDALETVIDNTAWMKIKLEEAREAVKNSGVAIAYDNGGGQKGIRENPLFKGYEALFKSYISGLSKILDAIPEQAAKEAVQEIETPKTVLELVRKKHGKEA